MLSVLYCSENTASAHGINWRHVSENYLCWFTPADCIAQYQRVLNGNESDAKELLAM